MSEPYYYRTKNSTAIISKACLGEHEEQNQTFVGCPYKDGCLVWKDKKGTIHCENELEENSPK